MNMKGSNSVLATPIYLAESNFIWIRDRQFNTLLLLVEIQNPNTSRFYLFDYVYIILVNFT